MDNNGEILSKTIAIEIIMSILIPEPLQWWSVKKGLWSQYQLPNVWASKYLWSNNSRVQHKMCVCNTAILCNNMTNSILSSHKSPLYHKVYTIFFWNYKSSRWASLEASKGHDWHLWDKAPLSYKQWPDQNFILISSTGLIDLLNMQSVTDVIHRASKSTPTTLMLKPERHCTYNSMILLWRMDGIYTSSWHVRKKKNLAVKQNPPKMGDGYSKPWITVFS